MGLHINQFLLWQPAYQSVALAKLDMHQDAADMLNEAAGLEEKKQKAMSLFTFLFMYAGFSESSSACLQLPASPFPVFKHLNSCSLILVIFPFFGSCNLLNSWNKIFLYGTSLMYWCIG